MGGGRGGLCNQVVILEKTKLYLKKKKIHECVKRSELKLWGFGSTPRAAAKDKVVLQYVGRCLCHANTLTRVVLFDTLTLSVCTVQRGLEWM